MNTLPHSIVEHLTELLSSRSLDPVLEALLSPCVNQPGVAAYTALVADADKLGRRLACQMVTDFLEKLDEEFRGRPERPRRYYVKNTRQRVLLTLVGEVRYRRTEYVERDTGRPYIYVDEAVGLLRRQRFGADIQAEAYALYSDRNSMIKVGETLGMMINGFEPGKKPKQTAVSRQQVQRMINRIASIRLKPPKAERTPEVLFIAADEKWVSLQRKAQGSGTPAKKEEMLKLAMIFSGREAVRRKDGTQTGRWELTGRRFFACPHDSPRFWDNLLDELYQVYDFEKIRKIYILGDGGPWIKAGVDILRSDGVDCAFALDRYHTWQYLHRITPNKIYRRLLYDDLSHGSRKEFNALVDVILQRSADKDKETIEASREYLLANMNACVRMENEVRIGCAMEQAIGHVFASSFTSVPKAFGVEQLRNYADARVKEQNRENMAKLYLAAVQKLVDETCARRKNGDFRTAVRNPAGCHADLTDANLDLGSIFDRRGEEDFYEVHLPFQGAWGKTR